MDLDGRRIGELVFEFYSAFDNRGGRVPDFRRLREIFSPDARIRRVSLAGIDSWTLDAFLVPRIALLTGGGLTEFHEWEVAGHNSGGGSIASRWSEYAKVGFLDGVEFRGSGRKLIQMIAKDGRWQIDSILWEDAEADPQRSA